MLLCFLIQGLENERNNCYMMVFQYGSVVLFNVPDREAGGYLKIVEKHASGLLREMRTDGEILYQTILSF